jgi:hypothetical protein
MLNRRYDGTIPSAAEHAAHLGFARKNRDRDGGKSKGATSSIFLTTEATTLLATVPLHPAPHNDGESLELDEPTKLKCITLLN